MDLRDPASWVRLEQAAERLLGCAYPAEGKKARIKRTADRP
jgi:hypothetical protein